MVLWEIAKLVQLNRPGLDIDSPDFDRFLAQLHIWPLTLEVRRALRRLDFRSDPADETSAATSLAYRPASYPGRADSALDTDWVRVARDHRAAASSHGAGEAGS